MFNEMEIQTHHLEQEAYCAVLRAFKAQGDAITWEKESLITDLRKELRVSDDEHRDILSRVSSDDVIRRIREWRQSSGHQSVMLNPSQAMSNARRKQMILTSVPSLSLGMHSAPLEQGSMAGLRLKRPKSNICPADIRGAGENPSEFLADGVGLQGQVDGGNGLTAQAAPQFPQNNHIGSGNKLPEDIEIFDTNTLIREVERVFNSSNPNPAEVETAKKMLREHEQALMEAITILASATDGDSDEEQ
uniref:ENT domain-containing protein n=1 Tax=Kalanchoe fedtschenkoi TaxID=63787 RepID=A0A7N0RH64_KALFE